MSNSFANPPNKQPQEAPSSNDLDSLRAEINRLTRPHEMPRRVELCREALKLVKREDDPEDWAWWHFELAYSLDDNPLGATHLRRDRSRFLGTKKFLSILKIYKSRQKRL